MSGYMTTFRICFRMFGKMVESLKDFKTIGSMNYRKIFILVLCKFAPDTYAPLYELTKLFCGVKTDLEAAESSFYIYL